MTSLFDASKLFNKDEWSDITIVCGDTKVKCHKIILCTTSEYFSKIFGPDSNFAEGQQKEVTLKDDDPSAIEAMLRYIYTFSYEDDSAVWKTWPAQLEVYKVARKYLVPKLEEKVLERLKGLAHMVIEASEIVNLVLRIEDETDGDIQKLGEELTTKHFRTMIQEETFKYRVTDDSDFMWKCFNRFSLISDMVEVEYVRCACSCAYYRWKGKDYPDKCRVYVKKCMDRSLNKMAPRSFWAKKEKDGSVVLPDGVGLHPNESYRSGDTYSTR